MMDQDTSITQTRKKIRRTLIARLRSRFSGAVFLTPAFAVATLAAYWLRFESGLLHDRLDEMKWVIPVAVIIKVAVFGLLRMTRSWHDYVSFVDLLRLGRATAISAAFLALVDTMYRVDGLMPRSVIIIDACLTALFVGGMLSARRLLREQIAARKKAAIRGQESERSQDPAVKTRVLLVGLNETSEAFLRSIRSGRECGYEVVGIVARSERMVGREVSGVPVIGSLEQVGSLATSHDIETLLIVSGELPSSEIRSLVDTCKDSNTKVRMLPSVQQIVLGDVEFRPREVAIDDLLGRDSVQLDQEQLGEWLTNKVLMVTGSSGSIGSEISRQLLKFSPSKLVLVDRSENGQFSLGQELQQMIDDGIVEVVVADINDMERMNDVISDHQPSVLFHAAAYKHVPLMEQHPSEAVNNITRATRGLVDLAHLNQVDSFVMISTDKAVNPTSVMGCCKRVAELYVQAKAKHSATRFVTVRFGNVLGSAGSVVPTFTRQILEGGPVTVTHPEMNRFFMTIPEASQLVIQAGAMGQGGEIFVLDMGEPVRIVDLAKDLVRLSGLQLGKDIEIQFTGLRPGEKMYEELYIEDEQRCPTVHPKILVAESEQLELVRVMEQIEELIEAAAESPSNVRGKLKQIVPRYKYNEGPQRKAA